MKALLLLVVAAPAVLGAEKARIDVAKMPLPVARKVDFTREVYPIFKESCFSCHGPEKQKGKYRMDTREGAFKVTDDYGPAIKAGKSEESAIIHMVCDMIDEMLMPPPSDKPGQSEKLSKEQIGILRAWIDQGAVWPDGPIQEVVKPVTFAGDIQPLFAQACASCHSGAAAKGAFAVDTVEAVLKSDKGAERTGRAEADFDATGFGPGCDPKTPPNFDVTKGEGAAPPAPGFAGRPRWRRHWATSASP